MTPLPPEHKKVKLMAIKMRKNASFMWENLKSLCERDDKKIETWEKDEERTKKEVPSL